MGCTSSKSVETTLPPSPTKISPMIPIERIPSTRENKLNEAALASLLSEEDSQEKPTFCAMAMYNDNSDDYSSSGGERSDFSRSSSMCSQDDVQPFRTNSFIKGEMADFFNDESKMSQVHLKHRNGPVLVERGRRNIASKKFSN